MPKPKILVVEDEMITALHLRQQLGRLGYEVAAAVASGEEALRSIEDLSPHLVLMDVQLAGALDGVETSRRIQEKSGIPVVYLTAYPNVFLQSPEKMQRPGICIAKPFSPAMLGATIAIALKSGVDTSCPSC